MRSAARAWSFAADAAAVAAALLASALAPALVVAPVGLTNNFAVAVFLVALAHAVVLGGPLYVIARRRGRTRPIDALLGGALVGAVPLALFTAFLSPPDFAWSGGAATVVAGVMTAAGWLQLLAGAAFLGMWGALAGLAFWGVLKLVRPQALLPPAAASAAPSNPGPRRAYAAAAGAVALSALLLAVPPAARDRTCHSPDPWATPPPGVVVRLDVGFGDWTSVAADVREVAAAEGLDFRDWSERRPGVVRVLGVSACDAGGVRISANHQHFDRDPDDADRELVLIVESTGQRDWRPAARRLLARLQQQWPGRVRLEDRYGRVIASEAVF